MGMSLVNPIAKINVGNVHFCKPQIPLDFMLHLYVSFCSIFNLIIWQCRLYGLISFRHKKTPRTLGWGEEKNVLSLKLPVTQIWLEIGPRSSQKYPVVSHLVVSHQQYPQVPHLQMVKCCLEVICCLFAPSHLVVWNSDHKHILCKGCGTFCINVSMECSLWHLEIRTLLAETLTALICQVLS